ncbi:hypothetical protein QTG56_07335 [Rossellomorea sp. AcN35-11]|nr:hypothetical protein [Rossellomorea aquimaris]WJV30828.1 hypothetical protein QTG56_07335 [Rossellomorea sp. AcN35-11]
MKKTLTAFLIYTLINVGSIPIHLAFMFALGMGVGNSSNLHSPSLYVELFMYGLLMNMLNYLILFILWKKGYRKNNVILFTSFSVVVLLVYTFYVEITTNLFNMIFS